MTGVPQRQQEDDRPWPILGETGDPNEPIGEFSVHMQVYGGGSVSCYGDTTMGTCTPSGWTDGQSTVTLLDPPGTVHDIPAWQGQAQAAVLKQLAADDNLATGKFTVTKEEHIDSPNHPVGHALINNTDEEQDTTLMVTDAVGTEDSVDVSITGGGKLFDIVELEIEAKYGHTWTTEHTFSQAVQVHVKAHYKAWVMAVEPLIRNTGDFTLELGNTTWILRDVYFDSPDPDGQGSYSVNDAPLTSEERANLPHKFFSTGAV